MLYRSPTVLGVLWLSPCVNRGALEWIWAIWSCLTWLVRGSDLTYFLQDKVMGKSSYWTAAVWGPKEQTDVA